MKNNKGEISIEMVITVIVLIVLGGICIFMLTGENGLFVLKNGEQNIENTSNTVNDNNAENTLEEQKNVTNNENGALTVPVE